MEIYLARHAAASEGDPERWPDDSERPLTPEGEEGFGPDPYVRGAELRRMTHLPGTWVNGGGKRAWRYSPRGLWKGLRTLHVNLKFKYTSTS